MKKANQIKDTADAIRGVVKAVPIYQDLLQPATREIGKNLETTAKSDRSDHEPPGNTADSIPELTQPLIAKGKPVRWTNFLWHSRRQFPKPALRDCG